MSLLAPVLEYSILNALLSQEIATADVDPKTLSQLGQAFHSAINKLEAQAEKWDIAGAALFVTQVLGIDQGRVKEYLAHVAKHATANARDVHAMLQQRESLLKISNEIQKQLGEGNLDLSRISAIAAGGSKASNLETVEAKLKDGAPPDPAGPRIKSLPGLSGVTNGLFGMWVIGGVPAVGKSTLALQIAIDVSGFSGIPTLYYDAENGEGVSLNRVVKSVGLDKARKLGTRLFLRESLSTLTRDLRVVKPPALVVVDSIQKISTFGDDRREGLNAWIRRLEALKKNDGYSVLLLSEIPRDKYTGNLGLDMFKETGALEYAADSAFGLVDREPFVAVQCVKNRHYEHKGQVALLERARSFWFKEADSGVAG